jgi:hypothetical protein
MIAYLQKLDSTQSRRAFRFALIQQVSCALISALMLDGGVIAKICAATIVGYWIAVAWLLSRRPLLDSKTDLLFVRWGFLLLFVVSVALTVLPSL